MGRLIVIEGLDGAGKRTLSDKLVSAFADHGATVSSHAFPRYGRSVTADLIRDGLYGRLGGLGDEVYGMGVLYALDRHGARDELLTALDGHDVVLLDRYVASNAAYGAARLHEDARGAFAEWVRRIEIERFELPRPAAQILLRVPASVAAERTQGRESAEAQARDTWEVDGGLQARCAAVYDQLAADSWVSPWHVVDGATGADAVALAAGLLG